MSIPAPVVHCRAHTCLLYSLHGQHASLSMEVRFIMLCLVPHVEIALLPCLRCSMGTPRYQVATVSQSTDVHKQDESCHLSSTCLSLQPFFGEPLTCQQTYLDQTLAAPRTFAYLAFSVTESYHRLVSVVVALFFTSMPILEGKGFIEVKNRLSSVRAWPLHTCCTAYSHKF